MFSSKPSTTPPKTPVKVKKDVTPNGTIRKTMEKAGKPVSETEETTDEFRDLLKEDGGATISCSITKGVDFNSEKVTFFVGVHCDQNTATMDKAAERVLMKAISYVNDGGELFGWKK